MTTLVIPFAGIDGKTRLHESNRVRREVSLAMLGDVVAAARGVGHIRLVTEDDAGAEVGREAGAEIVPDPGGGQGPAVQAALDGLEPGAIVIANADIPCVLPDDFRALLAATPAGGVALVEAIDGTTNALSIPAPEVFAPLYGSDSARRFLARARELGLEAVSAAIPNIADDVDTFEDLQRLHLRLGPRSQTSLATVPAVSAG
ncbi:MAG TPA: 2-phospho-L-lactate guanylyltransferase [Gaiellaceae bacterium]|nr:2-phospho-L-lactate guanylyltransferase [Gaiellaceae bacterium]